MVIDTAEMLRREYQEVNGIKTVLEITPVVLKDERHFVCRVELQRLEVGRWCTLAVLTGRGDTGQEARAAAYLALHQLTRFAPMVLSHTPSVSRPEGEQTQSCRAESVAA